MELIMTTLTLDTHSFVKKLTKAGVSEAQAEVLVETLAEEQSKMEGRFITRDALAVEMAKINTSLSDIRGEIGVVRAEITLLKWIGGFILTAIIASQFKHLLGL
jgi:hypothetical protein